MDGVRWRASLHVDFEGELFQVPSDVRIELGYCIERLQKEGPMARRPFADTLKGSKHKNMKELRLMAGNGAWRIAFAFDTIRQAVILAAGNKGSGSSGRFYKKLISIADKRFDAHLKTLKGNR